MDRMARKKERHNVSNLFDSVCACKAFFDRVVPTIHGVGGVYQTYIIYYESYLYNYILCKSYGFYACIYIYMSMYVCIPLYLIIHISETKCKSYNIYIYILHVFVF